jgi:apolipoprotein N-acyltransferase
VIVTEPAERLGRNRARPDTARSAPAVDGWTWRGLSRRGRGLRRVLVAAAAGGAVDAAFPGVGWWWLAPLGVAALILVVRGAGIRQALLLGFVFGVAFLGPHLRWTGMYVGAGPWLALTALESVLLAPVAVPAALAWRTRRPLVALVIVSGPAWVLMEAVRGRVPFGGFPWARLGFSQVDAVPALLAPLGGVPLVTWGVVTAAALAAYALAAAGQAGRDARARGHRTWVRPVLLLAVSAIVILPRPQPGEPAEDVLARVGVVQGDVPGGGLSRDAERRAVLDNHVRLTLELARRGERLDAVVWPENSSDIDPTRDPAAARSIQRAADAVGAPILVGAVQVAPDNTLRNTSIVWGTTQSGRPGQQDTYVKRRVVPFGEYIPMRPLVRAITSQADLIPRDFVGGRDDDLVRVGPLRAAVGICFEVAVDAVLRRSVALGAQVLVVPTNNATFGRTDQSMQQLQMSRMRAIEFGLTVVQASTTGTSAVIGPDGALLTRPTSLFEPAVVVADVSVPGPRTPATSIGGWLELLLASFGAAAGLLLVRQHVRQPDLGRSLVRERPGHSRRRPLVPTAPAPHHDSLGATVSTSASTSSPRPHAFTIRPATPADLDAVVGLHLEHLSHGLFPRLGTAFMRRYHSTFLELACGLSLVAVSTGPDSDDHDHDRDDEVVIGFVCGSTDQRQHVAEVISTARGPLLLLGAAGLLRRPRLLLHFIRTRSRSYRRRLLHRHDTTREPERVVPAPIAVLAAVAVSPSSRAAGAGTALVAAFVTSVQRAGTSRIELVTLEGPEGASAFYRTLGWTEVGRHESKDGQAVVVFRMELAGAGR